MKLLVDTSRVTFTVTREVQEKNDQNGRQKADRNTGEFLWTFQVMALDETGGEMLMVTVAGNAPRLAVGSVVRLVDLEAIPWATNGRNGVAYRVGSIQPQQVAKAA